MPTEIRLKYKWIRQKRKEVLGFLEKNYGIEPNADSKNDLQDDCGITGDDAWELIQKFEQDFIVDMSRLNFTEYFYCEGELDPVPSLIIIVLLKLFLLPFALLILPFTWSGCKEILLFNPFPALTSPKRRLTVGDLITSSFTHRFTLQKEVVLKLI